MTKMSDILEYTNFRLTNWYATAKRDYGIVGEGYANVDGDYLVIDYKENGKSKKWQQRVYKDDLKYTPVDFFYNIWAEHDPEE